MIKYPASDDDSREKMAVSKPCANDSPTVKEGRSRKQSTNLMQQEQDRPAAKKRRYDSAEEWESDAYVNQNSSSNGHASSTSEEHRRLIAVLQDNNSIMQSSPVTSNNRVAGLGVAGLGENVARSTSGVDGEIALQLLQRQRLISQLLGSTPQVTGSSTLALQLARLQSAGIARPQPNLLNFGAGNSPLASSQHQFLRQQENQSSQISQLLELQALGRGLHGLNLPARRSVNMLPLPLNLQHFGGHSSSALALGLRGQQTQGAQSFGRTVGSFSPGIPANVFNLRGGVHASHLGIGNNDITATVARPEGPVESIGDGVPLRLPCILARAEDTLKLSSHQVLLRHQIEAFQATDDDISTHTRGRNKPIQRGQVGIRCRHCAHLPVARRQKGSTYFPATLLGLYQAAQNMSTTHMQCGLCHEMPDSIKTEFAHLISTKVASSGAGRPYWSKSAEKLGLVDTDEGIRFIRDLPPGEKVGKPE